MNGVGIALILTNRIVGAHKSHFRDSSGRTHSLPGGKRPSSISVSLKRYVPRGGCTKWRWVRPQIALGDDSTKFMLEYLIFDYFESEIIFCFKENV